MEEVGRGQTGRDGDEAGAGQRPPGGERRRGTDAEGVGCLTSGAMLLLGCCSVGALSAAPALWHNSPTPYGKKRLCDNCHVSMQCT
jgi:hypothetical protein